MGIKLKSWQKGALLSAGFYAFWIGVIHQIFPEGPALDPLGIFLILPVLWISAIFRVSINLSTILLTGTITWGIIGGVIGYLIGYALGILKPKRGYNNEK